MNPKNGRLFLLTIILLVGLVFGALQPARAATDPQRPVPANPWPEGEAGSGPGAALAAGPGLPLAIDSAAQVGAALQASADRLAALQNNDGGWDWPLDDGNPATGTALNTLGPIGRGLAEAYRHTADPAHLAALQEAGALLLTKTNNFSASDGYLAAQLDAILGGSTYRQHVLTNFYEPLTAGTYNLNGAGTLYDTDAYVNRIRTGRASGGIPNLAAWDLGMAWVGATACGAPERDPWANGVANEINELDGDLDYDVLGLAGAVYGLAFDHADYDPTAGEHAAAGSTADLAAILASYQINNGGFAWNSNYVIPNNGNETIQETAYAILALNEVNRALYVNHLHGAADYMLSVQLATGGWENYAGDGENNEVSAEAAWGIGAAYPLELWVCPSGDCGHPGASYNTIQAAVNALPEGGTIYVAAGTYAESVTISAGLDLLCAQAGVPVGGRTAGSPTETVISADGLPQAITVQASNVTIDGCDIQGNQATFAGALLYASTSAGNLSSISIKNNFVHGMALPNPSSTAYVTSYGVFSVGDAVGGVRNTFTGLAVQGNKIYNLGGAAAGVDTSAGAGVWLYGVHGGSAGSGASLTGNIFENIKNGYDASASEVEYGTGVAIIDDGDPAPDNGGLVQSNTYANTFAGSVLYAGTTTFNEAAASFSGAGMYALNVGNLASVNETTLAKYAKTNKPTGFPSSTAYYPSIKTAVDTSDAGATVTVTAGTFNEGPQIVIAKDVTINGAGPSATIVKPTADTGTSGDAKGWFAVNYAIPFNLKNLTLDGSGFKIYQAIRHQGSGSIQNVAFKAIQYNPSGPDYAGTAVAAFGPGPVDVSGSTFSQIGRIGVLYWTTGSFTGNTYTGKGPGDWLDYAIDMNAGAFVNLMNNTVSNNRGVASVDGSTSAGFMVTTYYGAGTNASIIGNTLTDNTTAIGVGYDSSDTSTVAAHDNCMSGNGSGIDSTAPAVDAANNWWGSASGPYNAVNNPSGTGDPVSNTVAFVPWLDACHGSPVGGNFRNTTTMKEYLLLQQAVDDPATLPGHTIVPITAGPFPGTTTINKNGLTIDLSGRTFTGGSPAFEITANDVTIQGPGVLDGWTGSANNSSPAIRVHPGAGNFALVGVEVKRWADAVELMGSVTSFKVVSNWMHNNTQAGLLVDPGTSITGVLTIEGNLFKENSGPGVLNNSTNMLKAEYNSWGKYNGPVAGTDTLGPVDAVPWTYLEPYMDVDPDTDAVVRDVTEGQTFTAKLKVDAQRLYGLSFLVTYDPARLTLIGAPAFASPWTGKCTALSAPAGSLAYRCNLIYPDAELTATGSALMTLTFTTNVASLPGNGPWDTYFDISHLEADTSAGAVGGAKIWVNNAGYGAPSVPARDLTDADDGHVIIHGAANYTGFIDLQGRVNDSGAVVHVYDNAEKALSVELAQATSASNGGYTTAYLPNKWLAVGQTYYLFIDRALYLPTTIMMTDANLIPQPPVPLDWAHFKLLDTRPLTPLNLVVLLGGDAVSDNLIDILDAGCIGAAYNPLTPGASTCSGQGSSDVTGDTYTNIYDLTLMGGNYTKNYSPWLP